MTRKEAVKLIDPTAELQVWGNPPEKPKGYWVKGNGWETKVTYSESRAWHLALLKITDDEEAQ